MESSAKTRLPLNSIGIIYPSPSLHTVSPHWYNLSLIYYLPKGENTSKGLYISLISIRFWRFMPKGERVLAQSKRTAPPNFKNLWFSNWYLIVFKRGRKQYFQNWYLKTLLNTKEEVFIKGEFCLVKGKAFETGGENFKSWKCFSKSYSFTFDYLQKDFEKNF
jgi:hypothetical protein